MADQPSLVILYGSETGTAEEVAFKLHRTLSQNMDFSISSLDDYDVSRLPSESCIIWVIATAGEGEVPSNMKKFWNFLLRRNLSGESLKGVFTAVFGLGDSSYEKFNAAARRLNKRLEQLGSSEIIPIGLGDDQSKYGYFTELDSWVAKLLPLLQKFSRPSDLPGRQVSKEHYRVTVQPNKSYTESEGEYKQSQYSADEMNKLESFFVPPDFVKRHRCQSTSDAGTLLPIVGVVKSNTRITDAAWTQDVRHIVISLPQGDATSGHDAAVGTSHIAGDVATVHPINDPLLVSRIITALNKKKNGIDSIPTAGHESYSVSTPVSIECLEGFVKRKSRINELEHCTLGRLFSSLLDIAGIPQRGFFENLAKYTDSTDEREKLLEISSAEGTDLYYDYCLKEKRNYVEVLEDFHTAKPTLAQLLELIPVLQSRHYSIANSGLVDKHEVHLCVGVVSAKTPYGRVRTGICSAYLRSRVPGDRIVFWVRSGAFKLPHLDALEGLVQSSAASSAESLTSNSISVLSTEEGSHGSKINIINSVNIPKMIMIGPGTGVAPMRALIQERKLVYQTIFSLQHALNPDLKVSRSVNSLLFFGCRNRGNDFLYGEEWQALTGVISEREVVDENIGILDPEIPEDPDMFRSLSESVVVAFSRDQREKVYVTDKIKKHGQLVWTLLEEGAHVFISGSAKRMPADVKAALKAVITTYGRKTEEEAAAMLSMMVKKGKYVVEAWS